MERYQYGHLEVGGCAEYAHQRVWLLLLLENSSGGIFDLVGRSVSLLDGFAAWRHATYRLVFRAGGIAAGCQYSLSADLKELMRS
jgi:hypothetical protein